MRFPQLSVSFSDEGGFTPAESLAEVTRGARTQG